MKLDYKKQDVKTNFMNWLIEQRHRDDLVGDIAGDVKRELDENLIPLDIGYQKLYWRIKSKINPDEWDINFMDETGFEPFEKSGKKPPKNFVPFVNPLLCLDMAWHEFKTGENIVEPFMNS